MLFLLIGLLWVNGLEGKNIFDGEWKLDMTHSIGSLDDILALAGINAFKRWAIIRLEVTEVYEMRESSQSMRFERSTKYSNVTDVYPFGVAMKVDDPILGKAKQTFFYDGKRRIESRVEQENGSLFHSTRTILPGDDNRIVYMMNYTTSHGKANCVRYLNKNK